MPRAELLDPAQQLELALALMPCDRQGRRERSGVAAGVKIAAHDAVVVQAERESMTWCRIFLQASAGLAVTCGIAGAVLAARLPTDVGPDDRRPASAPIDITSGDATSNPVDRKADTPSATRRTGTADPANPLWAAPLSTLTATRERPLFSPSRRPPAPAVVAPQAQPVASRPPSIPEPDHPLLKLVGTVSGASEGIGIFIDETNKSLLRLKTGQQHGGWVLRAIHGRDAIFEKTDRDATLSLPPRDSMEPPPAAVASSAGMNDGSWVDGDGRLIAPPAGLRAAPPVTPTSAELTWTDGDGQKTLPPAAVRASGSAATPVSAAPQAGTTWMDGDGRMISPPR